MTNKVIAVLLSVLFIFSAFPIGVFASDSEDVIILYENDVHCLIEGYSKLSAMKKDLQKSYEYVGVVSGGDYIQGNSLGVISQGEYIVKLMNMVGYDAVALGNHEFDYRLERLEELIGMMNTKPVCCNFQKLGEDSSYFEPYTIVSYGDVEIAYIGVTTPSTITSSSPLQFKDENGEYLYTFNPSGLYDIVQNNIDSARSDGADYVVAVSHIGYADDSVYGDLEDVETLIKNTEGLDVVLDAHSHSVIECKEVIDEGGSTVLLSSTGTKFAYIGKMTISNNVIEMELIKTEEYSQTDPAIDAYIEQIYTEYSALGERKVAYSDVDLLAYDKNGKRLVRNNETNLGDLCADAFRYSTNADIGYVNGGGIRSDIKSGDITFNNLLNVLPFNNTIVLAEVSGQTIKNMMEMAVMAWPAEDGCFPHLSGITFSVNTAITSSVEINEFEEFTGVSGDYRVYDIKVFNNEAKRYEQLDLDKNYTLAASNYFLLEYGSGMNMLENAKIIQNDGMLDVEAVERYVVEALGGVIGQEYAQTKENITFTDGEIIGAPEDDEEEGTTTELTWISVVRFLLDLILSIISTLF